MIKHIRVVANGLLKLSALSPKLTFEESMCNQGSKHDKEPLVDKDYQLKAKPLFCYSRSERGQGDGTATLEVGVEHQYHLS